MSPLHSPGNSNPRERREEPRVPETALQVYQRIRNCASFICEREGAFCGGVDFLEVIFQFPHFYFFFGIFFNFAIICIVKF